MKARDIIEAEMDPRGFLKQTVGKILVPSDEYYLAIDTEPIRPGTRMHDNAEYVPMRVSPGPEFEQLDGMYGLTDDLFRHFDVNDGEFDTAAGRQSDEALDHYADQMYAGLRSGQLKGIADGVIGQRYWALVYWPDGHKPALAQYGVKPPYLSDNPYHAA